MRGSCEKKVFQEASVLSEKVSGHNPTLPILSAVLISAVKNKLNLFSTNLEMGLEVSVPSQVKKEGTVALPAKLLAGFLSSMPDNRKIEFTALNNNLVLSTPESSTTIKGYPAADFPLLPKIKEKNSFTVNAKDFVLGLKSVYYSSSLSEMRPELNSVFLSSSGNSPLVFVATDSFRLAEKNIPYQFSDFPNLLIPYRSVVEIIRILENRNDNLKMKLDENNVVLESGNLRFTSRLTGGNFPNYKQVVPRDFVTFATLNKKLLSNALKTSIMFCGKLNEARLKIYPNENFLEIQTNNPDFGENIIKIPGKITGENLSAVFNHRYLSDCLPLIVSENVVLRFAGDGKPLLVSPFGDNSFHYLVMPMKNI